MDTPCQCYKNKKCVGEKSTPTHFLKDSLSKLRI